MYPALNLRLSVWGCAAIVIVAVALGFSPSFHTRRSMDRTDASPSRSRQARTPGLHDQRRRHRLRQVTHFKDSDGDLPGWTKDGSKLVFDRHFDPGGPAEKLILYTARADGRR